MKIGILTFHHSNYNYGAVLQAYAVSKLIEDLGHESYIINYVPEVKKLRKKFAAAIVALLGFKFEIFRKKYISRILHKTQSCNDLKELNNILDGFVVGSDQVWRYRENVESLYKYYLNFVDDDKPKIAFAASFGIDYWNANKEVTNYVGKLIKRFDAISVREASGVKICRDIFNVESLNVLDPTLLVNSDYFKEIAHNNASPPKQKYIAYMLFDDTKQKKSYLKNLSERVGCQLKNINGRKIWAKKNFYWFKSVNYWLNCLKNAEFVVTDSFHCTVFSILFHRKFICVANPHKGVTRLENLLKLINLEDRLVSNIYHIKEEHFRSEINYHQVEQNLIEQRKLSIKFLRESLAISK